MKWLFHSQTFITVSRLNPWKWLPEIEPTAHSYSSSSPPTTVSNVKRTWATPWHWIGTDGKSKGKTTPLRINNYMYNHCIVSNRKQLCLLSNIRLSLRIVSRLDVERCLYSLLVNKSPCQYFISVKSTATLKYIHYIYIYIWSKI